MIKEHKEKGLIPDKTKDGEYKYVKIDGQTKIKLKEGIRIFTYDTKKIKEYCADCKKAIIYDEQRYIDRGNACANCNASYSCSPYKKLIKKINV